MPPKAKEILLVDDVQYNLRLLSEALKPLGHNLLACQSGEVALKVASKSQPDIILLDVVMPGMDGFETLERLKEQNETFSTRVMFVTTKNDPGDVKRFYEAGAVDYISKPICTIEVCRRVQTHLMLMEISDSMDYEFNDMLLKDIERFSPSTCHFNWSM